MIEISRLRQRLKNANPKSEYRMTVTEAQSLLTEVDNLLKKTEQLTRELEKQKELPKQVIVNEPTSRTRIIDGGAFK